MAVKEAAKVLVHSPRFGTELVRAHFVVVQAVITRDLCAHAILFNHPSVPCTPTTSEHCYFDVLIDVSALPALRDQSVRVGFMEPFA